LINPLQNSLRGREEIVTYQPQKRRHDQEHEWNANRERKHNPRRTRGAIFVTKYRSESFKHRYSSTSTHMQ
jgi:hypothetical protein